MFPKQITITQEMFDNRNENIFNCAGAIALKSIVGDDFKAWGDYDGYVNSFENNSNEVIATRNNQNYSMMNCEVGDVVTFTRKNVQEPV